MFNTFERWNSDLSKMFIRSSPFQTVNSFKHKARICFQMFIGSSSLQVFDLVGEQMSKNGNFPPLCPPQGALQRFYKGIRTASTSTENSNLKFGTFMAKFLNVTTRVSQKNTFFEFRFVGRITGANGCPEATKKYMAIWPYIWPYGHRTICDKHGQVGYPWKEL